MAILRFPVRNRTWSPLTLFRITFRNSIQHHRCKTCMYLDNSHTIEVAMKDITVRISNDADPVLLTRTLHVKFGIYIFLLTTEYVPVKQHNTIRAINLQEIQNTAVTCLFSGMSGKIVLL